MDGVSSRREVSNALAALGLCVLACAKERYEP